MAVQPLKSKKHVNLQLKGLKTFPFTTAIWKPTIKKKSLSTIWPIKLFWNKIPKQNDRAPEVLWPWGLSEWESTTRGSDTMLWHFSRFILVPEGCGSCCWSQRLVSYVRNWLRCTGRYVDLQGLGNTSSFCLNHQDHILILMLIGAFLEPN